MIAGITGPQQVDAPGWLTAALTKLISATQVTKGLTSLAPGAEQLFAEVLRARGLPYVAVLPCKKYESTFRRLDELHSFRRLLRAASAQVCLPFDRPSYRAYSAAGRYVVDNCELLIAVSDGQQARTPGSVSEVVAHAHALERGIRWIDPEAR